MAGRLRISVLGPLEISIGGHPVGPRGSRRRSLLALLALRANQVVGVDDLVAGLWGATPPSSATAVVQTYVSTWRKALEGAGEPGSRRITTLGTGYRLTVAEDECDLLEFLARAELGRRAVAEGRHAAGRAALEEALALWPGPVLPELADEPFHADAVRPLEDLRVEVVEDWARSVLESGGEAHLPAVLEALQRLRVAHPWREHATELLLWTLFRQGRQRESLESYEGMRRALADELGVDPGPGLRRMHERVLRQDPTLLPAPAVALRLALRPDAFVGRDADLADVTALLRSHRLVTLTGPAGSGKTRLAEEVAARRGGEAVLVDLAPVRDPALVPATIAARLGLATGEPSDVLVAMLAHRPLLLVLDNLEHLPGIAGTVSALLRSTTELRILATSREPVHLTGEQLYRVSPLPVPPPGAEEHDRPQGTAAVELLVARARERDPDFRITDGNGDALAQIVRALDGLPLALEIIAPWLLPLGPDGVLAQLRSPLDITGRRADSDPRHRTLREAISWSYERLSRDEQRLLARLSVLCGGGDLEAVRAVAGTDLETPVIDVLVDLVDRHLVQPPASREGPPRFRLLETVRRFATERLAAEGEAEATEARAAGWFARWAVWLAANSEGPSTGTWQAQAVADADNLRAAMDFLERTGQAVAHLQLVVDTMALWFEAGHEREGEARLERALTAAPEDPPCRAMALAYLAWLVATHDCIRATELARLAAERARADGDAPVLAFALQTLGEAADDVGTARRASREALEIAARLYSRPVTYGPTAGKAVACGATYNLAALEAHRALDVAVEWQRRALDLAEEEGDRRIIAANAARLGLLHLLGGDVAAATGPVRRAAGMIVGPLTARWEDIVSFTQAHLLHHEERTDEAAAGYRALITSALAGGRLLHVTHGSCCLADLHTDRRELEAAADALRRARSALRGGVDPRHACRLQVRRARLLRLGGSATEAAALLEQSRAGLDETALAPEHVIWLVEQAALAAVRAPDEATAWALRLDGLSRTTGVRVPPWERRHLAVLHAHG